MTLHIPRRLLDDIAAHASETYPEECCGFLVGSTGDDCTVQRVIRAKNVAPEPRTTRYTIDPLDIIVAEKKASTGGKVILGYYHSHPDHPCVPSEFDRSHAWPSYSYFIMRVFLGEPADFRSWRLTEDGTRFIQEDVQVE